MRAILWNEKLGVILSNLETCMTWNMIDIDDEEGHAMPVIMTLSALLPGGLKDLPVALRQALERDDYSMALSLANKAYASKGPADPVAPLTYIVLLVGRGLVSEANGILRRALSFRAQDISLQLAQIEALMVDSNYEAALALMEGMRSVNVAEPRHWGFLGDMYLDLGREEDAVDCYEHAVEMGTLSLELVFRLGQILLERGDAVRAARHFEHAARLVPDNLFVWETTADLLFEIGEIEKAIYAYTRVLKLDSRNVRAWENIGIAYQEVEEFGKAQEAFERIVALSPGDTYALLQLGHGHMALGYPEEALQTYRKVLREDPSNSDALRGAVAAAFEIGDMIEAEQLAREALARHSEDPEGLYSLGIVMLTLRRPQEAFDALSLAVKSSEEANANFFAALSCSEVMLGKLEASLHHIHQAVDEGVDGSSLLVYVEELLKGGHIQDAINFARTAELRAYDVTWAVVSPVISYLANALKGGLEEECQRYLEMFAVLLSENPQTVPVMWDFEEVDRIAMRLPAEQKKAILMMIGVLEGRKDIENFISTYNL